MNTEAKGAPGCRERLSWNKRKLAYFFFLVVVLSVP